MDFGKEDRNKVLQFVINKYGQERVVALGAFQYIWAKGAIKDIGRVLGIPFEVTNEMTSQLDKESIKEVIELGLLDKYVDKYPELFEYAERLAGLPKSFGAHPCFPKDTLVMTDNGYKKIQNINVGDSVLTHNNQYKYVVKTMKNTTDKLIRIEGVGFFGINSTPNHPYLVRRRTNINPKQYSEPQWIEAKNIVKSDMLCLPINSNNCVVQYKNLPTDQNDFWWIVGRYMGDGWCEYYELPRNEKRVIICCDKTSDKELNEIINKLNGLFEYRYVEENTTYKIFIKSNELFEFLQRFGKYANNKHLTKDIFDLPITLLEEFLNGYISADGYLDKNGYINIKTVSYELANGIIQCVGKTYHRNCSTFIIEETTDVIEGRVVNSKEKYIVVYKPIVKRSSCFYDEIRNCLWCYVKSNNLIDCKNNTDVYNLSVIDDNSYTVNNMAVHNCGKCCCVQETVYYNATDINEDGEYILQGDMHTAEDLGLIKADFLGLRTVDVIYDVLDMIGKDYQYIAPHNLDFTDKKVWESFRKGFTSGIFQFESGGMRDTLKKIDCSCIEDLSTANALFRPGSMKFIDNYANRKMGKEEITYIHKDLEQILKNSYGIIVYQEQLIEIGRLAKLSNPDKLRKATAKKNQKLLDEIKPELYSGLAARGWSQEQLDKLWDTMLDFAKYSFNKCVSGSTTLIKPYARKDRRNPTVEEMYKIVHDIDFAKKNNFMPLRSKYLRLHHYGTALSMFDDGRVQKNIIRDIKQSGVRDIYRVITESGKFLECTDNHKFPTPNDIKKLSELNVGDILYSTNSEFVVYQDKIKSIEYVKTEMTYDVTMDDPAHNFVANNGLITCNSHSSAYAIIAYICMYLKTYHPKEFVSAWINSVSGDIDSVAECIEEVRRLNIKVYIGDFNDCSPITKVYKDGIMMGTNTFKFCNSSIADDLMNLSQNNKYNNFIQLLDDINDKTSINNRQLIILTGLNYFHMFGNNKCLLNVIKYYNGVKEKDPVTKKDTLLLPALRTCKQIKKDKIDSYAPYGLTELIIEKYAGKETEKQYSQFDNVGMLMELTDRLKNESMPFYDYIKFEKEYLNYITYFNPTVADYYYLVADFKTLKDETKPYLVLRKICNGEEIKTRIKQSKIFKQNPFGEFSVLEIHDFAIGYKKKLIDGKWIPSDEEELLLEEYSVINNLLV